MNQTYMKEKKIFPLVMSMALPMMLSMAFNSLYNIVDSYFVAKLSEDAMTALSLVYPAQNLLTAVAVGFGVGVNAMISFYLGAQNQEKADKTATQGMVLGVLHGVLLMLLFLCGMNWFLGMFTKSDAVRALGMVTVNAARILGIEDRVGSLAVGMDADILVWSALPSLAADAVLERVIIDGKTVFEVTK